MCQHGKLGQGRPGRRLDERAPWVGSVPAVQAFCWQAALCSRGAAAVFCPVFTARPQRILLQDLKLQRQQALNH